MKSKTAPSLIPGINADNKNSVHLVASNTAYAFSVRFVNPLTEKWMANGDDEFMHLIVRQLGPFAARHTEVKNQHIFHFNAFEFSKIWAPSQVFVCVCVVFSAGAAL